MNDAKGIFIRNNIDSRDLGEEYFAKLEKIDYCLKKDNALINFDNFGPLQKN